MNNRPQPPRRPQAGNQRPAAQQQPTATPRRVQRDATQDYARRKAAYERHGHIIYTVKIQILQNIGCAAFAGTGKTGYN